MIDLLTTEKELISPHIKAGGTAIDFTMGNGHDTLWLSRAVGDNGHVFAFDIQEAALENTKELLSQNGRENCTLILDSHSNVKEYVKEPICVGLFNLGYLPGGDRTITTKRESTIAAIRAAIDLLLPGGGLLIAVYPGHAEGSAEGKLIEEELSKLDKKYISCSKLAIINSPTSPFFFLVEKRD
ncbi:MAG: class I SAM-dependent methyltransferase [Clostridia bacterium]|nr:class I SAM-dependent methyltransferase [Clostridia bacterium]